MSAGIANLLGSKNDGNKGGRVKLGETIPYGNLGGILLEDLYWVFLLEFLLRNSTTKFC